MNSDFVSIRHPGLRLLLTLVFESAFSHGGGGGGGGEGGGEGGGGEGGGGEGGGGEGRGGGGGCAVVW